MIRGRAAGGGRCPFGQIDRAGRLRPKDFDDNHLEILPERRPLRQKNHVGLDYRVGMVAMASFIICSKVGSSIAPEASSS